MYMNNLFYKKRVENSELVSLDVYVCNIEKFLNRYALNEDNVYYQSWNYMLAAHKLELMVSVATKKYIIENYKNDRNIPYLGRSEAEQNSPQRRIK